MPNRVNENKEMTELRTKETGLSKHWRFVPAPPGSE